MAQKLGYFKEAGLDVAIEAPSDPSTPIKEVAAGQTDLAISYEPEVMLAHDQGLDVVAVGALVDRPLTSMIWLKKSGIKGVADLRGKTIATAGIPYQDAFLKTILARAHLTPSDVKAVNVGFGLLPALVGGRPRRCSAASATSRASTCANAARTPSSPRSTNSACRPTTSWSWSPSASASKKTRNRSASSSPPSRAAPRRRSKTRRPRPRRCCEANPDLEPKLIGAEVKATLPLLAPNPRPAYGYMDPAEWTQFIGWMRDNGLISSLPTAAEVLSNAYLPGEDLRIAGQALARAAGGSSAAGSARREEVALGVVAAEPAQLRELGLVLDPLGDHVQREGAGHADDRLDDRRALLLDPERVDEGAVDLQRVEGEAVEVGERGVAGAEVVEDEPHADLAERLQGGHRGGRLLDQDALGDLQAQVDGVEPGAGEDLGDRWRRGRGGRPGGRRG